MTTPTFAQPGHDFTLQAVMELQKSVGSMSAKIDRVIEDVKDHGAELTGISRKINFFLGGATVVGAIAGIVITIVVSNWDSIFPPAVTPNTVTTETPANLN